MNQFMPELSPQERRRYLEDNCDKREETTYMKDLSKEDLDVKRESLAGILIEVANEEADFELVKAEHNEKVKPKRIEAKLMLQEIKLKKAEVKGVVFHIADQEASIMNSYDEHGDFLGSRRLRPDEKQSRMPYLVKSATND